MRKTWNKMDALTRIILVLTIVLGAAVYPVYVWAASDQNYLAPESMLDVGGIPPYVRIGHTSGSVQYTIGVPAGFKPGFIQLFADADTTNTDICWWLDGASPSYMHLEGTSGVITYGTSNGISVSATTGEITVGTVCLTDGGTVKGIVFRQ